MTNEKVFAIAIPWMNANLDAVNRLNIPVEIQGRVFAARNSFQFFTIRVGYFMGGLLVDLFVQYFGSGKGSGAAFLFAILWLMGIGVCLLFRYDRNIWRLEE